MNIITAAPIIKCQICGTSKEMEPLHYPLPNGSIDIQRVTVMNLAEEFFNEKRNSTYHYCDYDRHIGRYEFAGVKLYGTREKV